MGMRRYDGFTIVELLIVIVVIGLLAAISIVAYRGIQQRSTTAAYVSAVEQWEKLLRTEYALYGTLPNSGTGWSCVGNSSSNFTADSTLPAGVCLDVLDDGAGSSWQVSYDATFMNQFKTIANFPNGQVSKPLAFRLEHGTATARGVIFNIIPVSSGFQVSLVWYPPDRSTCGRGADEWAANPYTTSAGCRVQFELL